MRCACKNKDIAISAIFLQLILGMILIQSLLAQSSIEELIGFERLDIQSLFPSNCQAAQLTPNLGAGVAVLTLSVPCNSVAVTGTATITYPTGTLTGVRTQGVFKLNTPSTAAFSATVNTNVNQLAGWTVVANLGVNYVGDPVFENCRPSGPISSCSVPFLRYGLDQISENPFMLIRLVFQRAATSESFSYDIKIFFAAGKLGVDHLEMVQVVQDAKNTVPLIAGRPTLLRAFIQMPNEIADVTATVRATRGEKKDEVSGSPKVWKFKAKTEFNRNQTGGSENFELPLDWTAEGTLNIEFEIKLPEGAPSPGNFKSKEPGVFRFQEGKQDFSVGVVQFCYCLPGERELKPYVPLILASGQVLEKVYPINPDHISYRIVSMPLQIWTDEISGHDDGGVLSATQKIYDTSIGKGFDQLVAWLPESKTSKLAGTSYPKWDSWFGRGHASMVQQIQQGASLVDPVTVEYNAGTIAHEIAHNLGRRHTNNRKTKTVGWCSDYDGKTDFPYATPLIQEPGWDGISKSVIAADASDLMSYCRNNGIPRWISPFTYLNLFAGKLLPGDGKRSIGGAVNAKASPKPALGPAAASAGESIVISGVVGKDGRPSRLDPVYRVPSDGLEEPSLDSGASHCLRFSGAAGASLGQYCFFLPFEDAEDFQPLDRQFFGLKVPFPGGVTRVALLAGNAELASLSSSSAPPTLAITSPKAGDRWDSGTLTISWTAASKDGKPLTYAVLYSADGGQSWLPIALDIRTNQHTFDSSQIDGGKNMMFRVMASDGLDSTTVNVGPLELVQTASAKLSTASIDFGNQAVDQAVSKPFTISNTGNGPLNILSFNFDKTDLRVAPGQTPLLIPAGESSDLNVQWFPRNAGALTATLKIATNDALSPSVITLTGKSDVTSTCSYSLSATSVTIPGTGGSSAVDLNSSLSSCAWKVTSNSPWISVTSGSSSTGSGSVSFTVLANPTTTSRSGILTIAGLAYTIKQDAGTTNLGGGNAVLQADGGTFYQALGYPSGKSNVLFVVRLKPPSYPATLNAVQIYFGKRADGLPQNAGITILAGSSAATPLDGVTLARSVGSVGTLDGFNIYPVAAQTINAGDFVVGFAVDNPRGILPADQDVSTPSKQRSYVSADSGKTFQLLDDFPGVGGNLGIRSTVTVGVQ